MKITLRDLKANLAKCHVKNTIMLKTMLDSTPEYWFQQARMIFAVEADKLKKGQKPDSDQLKLIIQLINMVLTHAELSTKEHEKERTRSQDSSGDNSSPQIN